VTVPVLEAVARLASDEDHVTEFSVCEEPSVNVPVAVKSAVSPAGTELALCVTAIETSSAAEITMVAEPETEPTVALITALPAALLVTTPLLLTVATLAALEDHVADELMSFVVPSL
jgi:hypothetical protein